MKSKKLNLRKWVEPRSKTPGLKIIVWVTGVLRRTVFGDRRSNNLCGSHLQSQLTQKMAAAQLVQTSAANKSRQDFINPDDHNFSIKVENFVLAKT